MEENSVKAPGKLRVFLALPFFEAFPAELEEVLCKVRALPWDFRWNPPDLVHLTLYFFGSVTAEKIPLIESAAQKVIKTLRPFSLGIEKLGFFPDVCSPRIVWAGICGDLEMLSLFQNRLAGELLALGFEQPEHPFNPHLTLGRRKTAPLKLASHTFPAFSYAPKPMTSLRLYRSILSPQGSQYSVLRSFPLPL